MESSISTSDMALVERSFDASYYLSHYRDVEQANCDPARHYCDHGWREGRNPSAEFDTRYYLEENRDVAQAGINPFIHYLFTGRAEGRKPRGMDSGVLRIASARSAADQAADAVVRLGDPRRLQSEDLSAALVTSECRGGIVVSVSHDDYCVSVGGIQNILGDECAELNHRGFCYLHLCPSRPLRSLSAETELVEFEFAVRLNGRALGRIGGMELQEALRILVKAGVKPYWVLHHLMGHSPEVIEQLVSTGCADSPLFWAHDFFAACSSYTLMRNDVAFCHAPPLDSPGCRVCAYGKERSTHTARMSLLLNKIRPMIVAPSHSALELWRRSTRQSPARSAVVEPARLLLTRKRRPVRSRPLRVGYLGAQVFHKGWDVYRRLAESFQQDERFEFFQLGEAPAGTPRFICNVPVRVTGDDRDAMLRAVALHEIDAVVCWSLWPETFNFTVHEAIAGGAFVLALRKQGNVWPAASAYAPQASRAFDDEAALQKFLRSGEVLSAVDASPRYLGAALQSMGSAELLAFESWETAQK